MSYRYQLEDPRLTGRRKQKATCPSCGRRRCLVRYVDTTDPHFPYLADTVGRCDHEHSCGYHYTPAQYFRDNPWLRRPAAASPLPVPGGFPAGASRPAPSFPSFPLDPSLPLRCHSPQSTFFRWLSTVAAARLSLTPAAVARVYADYLLGATRQSDVIFWQIDAAGHVRGGHIMQYGPDGHRLGYQSWVHTRLISLQQLPPDYQLRQCLFGEHLLPRRPEAQVAVVESEKTAILLSACYPQHLWLACGGSGGLSADKLRALRGRDVTFFPDAGCLAKWRTRLLQLAPAVDFSYVLSTAIETEPPNTDLADILLAAAADPP